MAYHQRALPMTKRPPTLNSLRSVFRGRIWVVLSLIILLPSASHATQAHAAPEGLYTHQIAHIFFMIALCWLIYWLQKRHLIHETGWRQIQFAAICLILWNIDAFLAHLMDEQLLLVDVQRVGNWQIRINSVTTRSDLAWIYYLLKLDHLLCVPAMCFFYVGLKRLLSVNIKSPTDSGLRIAE